MTIGRHNKDPITPRNYALIAIPLMFSAAMALAHGDKALRAVDTAGLPDLPAEMAIENPWRAAKG